MPTGHWLIIDPPADNKIIPVEDTVSDVRGIRVEDSPLLRAVDLTGLVVSRMKKIQPPLWAQDVITSSSGPLLSVGRTEGRNVIIVAFDLRATNLVLRSAFPILVGNMIEWLSPRQSPAPSVAVDEREADITPSCRYRRARNRGALWCAFPLGLTFGAGSPCSRWPW
ncbi:MAG: hypothetical protein C4289_08655 [Chloroflexota bacterium]